nr:hypothetical protein [Tanacetum cinerariifolium]
KPTDQKKIPSEVLTIQGKSSVFQFHFNSLANITYFTFGDVFDIRTQDQSTSGSAEEAHKGTPPPKPAETAQPAKNEEKAQRGKEKSDSKQKDKGTPPPSPAETAQPVKNEEQAQQGKEKTAKGPSFSSHPLTPRNTKETRSPMTELAIISVSPQPKSTAILISIVVYCKR